jgi:hypothetical protein
MAHAQEVGGEKPRDHDVKRYSGNHATTFSFHAARIAN